MCRHCAAASDVERSPRPSRTCRNIGASSMLSTPQSYHARVGISTQASMPAPFPFCAIAVQYRLWKRHCTTSWARSAAPTPHLPPMRSIASSAPETARWPAPSAMWRRRSCCRFIRRRRSIAPSTGAPGAFRPPRKPCSCERCRSNRAAPHPAWPPSPCLRSPGPAQAHACTAPTMCACPKLPARRAGLPTSRAQLVRPISAGHCPFTHAASNGARHR